MATLSGRMVWGKVSRLLWLHVARPYWAGTQRTAALFALVLLLTLAFSQTWFTTLTATLGKDLYDATIARAVDQLYLLAAMSVMVALASAAARTAEVYVQQWIEIRWRGRATEHLVGGWLRDARQFRLERDGTADNPDARIEFDTGVFIGFSLTLFLLATSSVVSIVTFSALLWSKGEESGFAISGQLTLSAWLWAALQIACVQWAGRRLVPVTERQEAVAANFRFAMSQIREAAEQIALYGGEAIERQRLRRRFQEIVDNFRHVMTNTMRMNMTNLTFIGLSSLVPTILLLPAQIEGSMNYGQSIELGILFGQLVGSLVFFATAYEQWVICTAAGRRLAGLAASLENLAPDELRATRSDDGHLRLCGLVLRRPQGDVLVGPLHLNIAPGGKCLIVGPSGVGKSTLLRAMAGLWSHGEGEIQLPHGGRRLFIPQRAYLPPGTLKEALAYPESASAFSDEACADVLRDCRLHALAPRLHDEAPWSHELSMGEQQRLAFARALLMAPDQLFMDESTSALDEDTEAAMYQLLLSRLAGCMVVSVAHRSTVQRFHQQQFRLSPALRTP